MTLTLLLSTFLVDLGAMSARRAHAQTAADAAALAAVAESAPFGGGAPALEARRFALANGATLIDCICDAGSDAAEVLVAIGDVRARARAVIDPELFLPAQQTAVGLDPALAVALDELLGASAGRVSLVSGFRSVEEQRALWDAAVARYGSAERADDWVAPPGASMHNLGLAVDLGGDLDLAVALIEELDLPLWRPLSNEPWHFELEGSR